MMRAIFRRYWEWAVVIPIFAWMSYVQSRQPKPTVQTGLSWLGSCLLAYAVMYSARHFRDRRAALEEAIVMQAVTPGSVVPPVIFQIRIQATRAFKSVIEHYPEDVAHVVFVGGYDGNLDDLHVLVILKGALGDKISVPFPGDPAGAWMLDDSERETLLRIRSIVWSYAMPIGDANLQPPVIFDSLQRLAAERGTEDL